MIGSAKEEKWPAWSLARVVELSANRDNTHEVRRGRDDKESRKTTALKVVHCVHIGEPLTMKEVQEAGLNPRRKWHRCEKGLTKNKKGVAGVSCSCEGCNSKCEGYEKP